MYVAFLGDRMKFSSVVTYYQAVVYVHTCYGLEPVRLSNPVLKATMSGIQRMEGNYQVGKDPIFPGHLAKIAAVVDNSDRLELTIFVAMLFLFRTLLRVSHVIKSDHTIYVQVGC